MEPAIYLFKDFHRFTEDERCNLTVIRRLRDVAHHLRDTYKTIVITSPLMRIAPELTKDVTVVEFGLPGPEDFNQLLGSHHRRREGQSEGEDRPQSRRPRAAASAPPAG